MIGLERDLDRVASLRRQRPFPGPRDVPWFMAQQWRHLMAMHWRYPAEVIRPLVPAALDLDLHDGSAWVSVLPMLMAEVHLRGVPPIGMASNYPELNFRTYVVHDGVPGVWFFRIWAGRELPTWIGDHVLHAPYVFADLVMHDGASGIGALLRRAPTALLPRWCRGAEDDRIRFHSGDAAEPAFSAVYRGAGELALADPGSTTAFLCERYALYVLDRNGDLFRGDLQHDAWQVQPVEAEVSVGAVFASVGLPSPQGEPLRYYAPETKVVVWPLLRLGS